MVDVTFALVAALILLQLYICAVTYWVFRKIDKYENFAFSVIERYLKGSHVDKYAELTNVENIDVAVSPSARAKVIGYINTIGSYTPSSVQKLLNAVLTQWYSQLSIDIISLCLQRGDNQIEYNSVLQ